MIPRLKSVFPGFMLGLLAIHAALPPGLVYWGNPLIFMSLVFIGFGAVGVTWLLKVYAGGFLKAEPGQTSLEEMSRILLGIAFFSVSCSLGWTVLFMATLSLAGPEGHSLRLTTYMVLSGVGVVAGPIMGIRLWLLLAYLAPVMLVAPLWDLWVVGGESGWLAYLNFAYVGYLVIVSRRAHHFTSGESVAFLDARERAGYYRSVIESVPGIVTILGGDLRYQMVNEHLSKFFGINESEVVGQPVGFLGEDDFTDLVHRFSQAGSEQTQGRCRLKGIKEDRWFLVSLTRMACGKILAVSLDIQDQVNAERRELDQRAKSEMSARLVAVGEMAAGVAHEINNPLAIILSNSEHVAFGRPKDEDLQRRMGKIKEMVLRIARIGKCMTALARDDHSEQPTQVKVAELFDEVSAVFDERMRVEGVVFLRVSDPIHLVMGRRALLSRMLLNLLGNALDAVRGREGAEVQLRSRIEGGNVVIEVLDNGPGVPAQLRDKIMVPFFTTKPPGRGTGLGLAISQKIAQDHGGSLSLSHRTDRTTFVVELPECSSSLAVSSLQT